MSNQSNANFDLIFNPNSFDVDEFGLFSVLQSSSEVDDMDLQRVNEEIDSYINFSATDYDNNFSPSPPPPPNSPPFSPQLPANLLDPIYLRRQLDKECAFVASLRENNVRFIEFEAVDSNNNSQDVGAESLRLSSNMQEKSDIPVVEVEANFDNNKNCQEQLETNHHDRAIDAKLKRRKDSNKAAARRSRARKKQKDTVLETQFSELREQNLSLSKQLVDIKALYDGETNENTTLRAQVDNLRAEVQKAETNFKGIIRTMRLTRQDTIG